MKTKETDNFSDIKLSKISIKGFKSIENLQDFSPNSINLLIGANGAGKSNFIAFFRFLSWMLSSDGKMQEHIASLGGASSILHDGSEKTKEVCAHLEMETRSGWNEYKFRLFFAAGDTLIFAEESSRFSKRTIEERNRWHNYDAGHRESKLLESETKSLTADAIVGLLRKIIVYQFHNTSQTARIRNKWNIEDSRWLKEDGANLAPLLFRLQKEQIAYYKKIVKYIRLVIPFFDDFQFDNEYGKILLKWKEKNTDMIFNASQASDGMLRTIALITLLGQPERDLPNVMFIDEPELGLHPFAVNVISEVLKTASRSCQIFVATQSSALIDNFLPEEVIVINRKGRKSEFKKYNSDELEKWLEEYSLAELWEKNVIGGRP